MTEDTIKYIFNYNNGLNCKQVEGDYLPAVGEIVYDEHPGQETLESDFPEYAALFKKADAQKELALCDSVATRCFKAGIDFPTEWRAYDIACRNIVRSGSGDLPSRPDFPAGS